MISETKNLFWLVLSLSLMFIPAEAKTPRSYPSCDANSNPAPKRSSTSTDNLNPQVEGQPMKGSCPPDVVGSRACTYYTQTTRIYGFEARKQNYCVSPGTKDHPSARIIPNRMCCRALSKSCVTSRVEIAPFYQRLINRPINKVNTCCVEHCPTTDYWTNMPAGALAKKTIVTENSATAGVASTFSSSLPAGFLSYNEKGAEKCNTLPTNPVVTNPEISACVDANGQRITETFEFPNADGTFTTKTEPIPDCGSDYCPGYVEPTGSNAVGGGGTAPPTINGEF